MADLLLEANEASNKMALELKKANRKIKTYEQALSVAEHPTEKILAKFDYNLIAYIRFLVGGKKSDTKRG